MRPAGRGTGPGAAGAAVFLCVLLLSVTAAASGAAPAAYPPMGAPAPDAPCARSHPAAELDFFCRFLTLERWLEAGRPEYVEAGGKRWQVWFYGKDGLTNQLLVEGKDYVPEREGWFEALFDVGNFEAQTYSYFWDLFRYAPWSVQFLYAGACHGGQALAPAALASARFRRMHVFGLGWPGLAADPADPGRAFGPAAFPLLLTFADLPRTLEPALRVSMTDAGAVRAEVNALAAGRGRLWPDYARDGGVWLIDGDGAATAMTDLDAAAKRLATAGVLVTNDAMRSWESGRLVAAGIAHSHGPVLYLYFAQDPFLPVDPAGAYGRRLDYLLDRTAAAGGKSVRVISYGRSAGVVARALAGRAAVAHQSYAPAVSPLDAGEYAQALRRAVTDRRIDIAAPALSMEKGAPADCLDPLS